AQAQPTAQARQAVAAAAAKTKSSNVHVDVDISLRKPGATNVLVYGASGNFTPDGGRFEIDRRRIGGSLQHEIVWRKSGHLILYTNPTLVPLPKGKTWLEVDMSKYALDRYGANTTFLAGADQDPIEALDLVTAKAAQVTDLGQDWLPDNTLNQHYRAKVNIVSVAKDEGVKGAGLQALIADLGRQTQTIDIWVSKQGRVARVEVQSQVTSNGTKLQQKSIADFTKYGEQVSVSLPPAKKTQDYFQLTSK
ncbi:MAG: hypothetical protein ACRDLK_08695, partial [Gaiellaceae bacterium]